MKNNGLPFSAVFPMQDPEVLRVPILLLAPCNRLRSDRYYFQRGYSFYVPTGILDPIAPAANHFNFNLKKVANTNVALEVKRSRIKSRSSTRKIKLKQIIREPKRYSNNCLTNYIERNNK